MTRSAVPSLRERLREVRFTRSAMWGDAELVCQLVADVFDMASEAMNRAAGRCYRNAKAAQRAAAPSGGGDEAESGGGR